MSKTEVRLCSLILREHYGEIVDKVGTNLLKNNCTPLRIIVNETKLKHDQVKKALCTLIQQNIVTFEWNVKGFVTYSISVKQILSRLRFPQYIFFAKTLYKDSGELLVEELLEHGQMLMSHVIQKVIKRLNEACEGPIKTQPSDVRDTFVHLAQTQFVQRCPSVQDPEAVPNVVVPNLSIQDCDLYKVPELGSEDLRSRKRKISDDDEDSSSSVPAKRQKTDSEANKPEDGGIYWKLNFERFDRYTRDLVIVNSIASKVDMQAAEIVRTMLRISEVKSNLESPVTSPMSNNEIFQALPTEFGISHQSFDQYLKILSGDSTSFILKTGESGGGMYAIDFKKALSALCAAHLESVVQERFGSKCFRIFRLLIMKKHLEQKQIEEFAMIPGKEAKEMLYRMFGEHFIALTEVPRTPDHAPSRTFYLFSVNQHQVARMILQRAYKTMNNLILRRQHEISQNKRLLDKQQRVEAIIATLESSGADEAQKEEIQETITPPERTQINKIKHITNKLEKSELQLDETIFVLDLFLKYQLVS